MQTAQGHIQSIGRDARGIPEGGNLPLRTPNGGVSVGPRVDYFPLSQILTSAETQGRYLNMQRLEAICLATGLSSGVWNVRTASGAGSTVLQVLQQPIPSIPGTRYVWEFPTPLQTGGSSGRGFHVEPSASGMGTWFFFANGNQTPIEQGGSDF